MIRHTLATFTFLLNANAWAGEPQSPCHIQGFFQTLTTKDEAIELRDLQKLSHDRENVFLFKNKLGEKYVVKPQKSAHEVAAHLIDQKLNLNFVPKTKEVWIEGKRFSAQRYVEPQKIMVVDPAGKTESRYLAQVSEPGLPDELKLFDALIANIDRKEMQVGHNYFVLTHETLPEVVKSNGPKIKLKHPSYVAFDHDMAFSEIASSYTEKTLFSSSSFHQLIKRNPSFMGRLSRLDKHELRKELQELLPLEEVEGVMQRRKLMLEIYQRRK